MTTLLTALERIASALEAERTPVARRYVVDVLVHGDRYSECYEVFSAVDAIDAAKRRAGVSVENVRALLPRECPLCCNANARDVNANHCDRCGRSDAQVERDFVRRDSR